MNQIAFVTGASRGIGKAIALDLLAKNYRVAVGYHSNKTLAYEISSLHSNATPIKVDVSSAVSIMLAFKEIEDKLGKVDILVNNAGISQVKSFEALEDKDWEVMWETNFMSAVRCTRLALPSMVEKGFGRIINIASIGGQWGGFHQIHYAATKAALINLTKSIAKVYSSEGICCNAVAPGLIDTDMIIKEVKNIVDTTHKGIPVGRVGSVQEVSALVGFLCGSESSYITGQTYNVNGGMNLCE
jgi:NAD(P)-dependent dehydrogenase (short-subunit alcohol dehydrogenase family)